MVISIEAEGAFDKIELVTEGNFLNLIKGVYEKAVSLVKY